MHASQDLHTGTGSSIESQPETRQSIVAKIHLDALSHNFAIARKLAPNSEIMAVIKANAYGHGIVPIAAALKAADLLAVARLDEALRLRTEGIDKPIVVFSELISPAKINTCSQHDIGLVIHNRDGLNTVIASSLPVPIDAWLKLDTGMHRLGFSTQEFAAAYQDANSASSIRRVHLMSHFATADHMEDVHTDRQTALFESCTTDLKAKRSLANSAATLSKPHTHLDVVRPGIMLYGVDPLETPTEHSRQLKAVMHLEAPVIAVREIGSGESVGYNRRWISKKPSRIATIGIGYADGYPRSAPNLTPVAIRGHRVPLVGYVSMDMICVDITAHPEIQIGDMAQLWGDQVRVAEVADLSGTIAYELLTRVGKRVRYDYIRD